MRNRVNSIDYNSHAIDSREETVPRSTGEISSSDIRIPGQVSGFGITESIAET
jgi:hypothetical protein